MDRIDGVKRRISGSHIVYFEVHVEVYLDFLKVTLYREQHPQIDPNSVFNMLIHLPGSIFKVCLTIYLIYSHSSVLSIIVSEKPEDKSLSLFIQENSVLQEQSNVGGEGRLKGGPCYCNVIHHRPVRCLLLRTLELVENGEASHASEHFQVASLEHAFNVDLLKLEAPKELSEQP